MRPNTRLRRKLRGVNRNFLEWYHWAFLKRLAEYAMREWGGVLSQERFEGLKSAFYQTYGWYPSQIEDHIQGQILVIQNRREEDERRRDNDLHASVRREIFGQHWPMPRWGGRVLRG